MKTADSGNRTTFHFCPDCGSDVHYAIDGKFDGLIAIPLGAFDDPYFAKPAFSVWESASTTGSRFRRRRALGLKALSYSARIVHHPRRGGLAQIWSDRQMLITRVRDARARVGLSTL